MAVTVTEDALAAALLGNQTVVNLAQTRWCCP